MGPGDRDTLEATTAEDQEVPRFTPLRRASRPGLAALYIIGPLLWIVAGIVVARALRHGEAIKIALIVLAAALLLALTFLLPLRVGRVRRERGR